jgi:zinc transport system ATP-binding protein
MAKSNLRSSGIDPVISMTDVSFSYGRTTVLERIDLSISEGDFACVIGPNGGGKTTLLRLILGVVEPSTGRINVLGESPYEARPRIGYMPQHVRLDPQFPVTVLDVVLMGRLGRSSRLGPFRSNDKAAAEAALEQVGLIDEKSRPFSRISGGQRQRVLIARAIASEPQLLLLDEPTANLDPVVQEDLYGLLRERQGKMTVIVASHDVGFVSLFFNTAICVNRTVHVHPMSELTGSTIADMYGREVRFVHRVERDSSGADG